MTATTCKKCGKKLFTKAILTGLKMRRCDKCGYWNTLDTSSKDVVCFK